MSSPSQGVSIALLSEQRESGEHLRAMIAALGASIVYESTVSGFDRAALADSKARVVIVNLDSEDDPGSDSVSALLDDDRYEVIFNDAEVSRGLSGWDQARWLRHFAAKISGVADIDPPRPAGAEAVPVPARRDVPADVPAAPRIDPSPVDAPPVDAPMFAALEPDDVPEPVAETIAIEPEPEVDLPAAPAATERLVAEHLDSPIEVGMPSLGHENALSFDLDVDFDDTAATSDGPTAAVPVDDFSAFDFDLDFDAPPAGTPAQTEYDATVTGFDPDADAGETIELSDPAPAVSTTGMNWTLEEVLDNPGDAPPVPASGADNFGIETMTPAEYLAPPVDPDAPVESPIAAPSGLTLELIPLEEAVAPTAMESLDHENWLDPDKVAKSKIARIWVLGASIGGPESVREFLGEFPRDYPALFLLAQHMGDEFVDTMTQQLARSTALTVRMPGHGERAGHGEVLVVPNSQRLRVDRNGVVVLERTGGNGAYNPSIDRVLQDVAERFGADAGAIIFSGMSDDAAAGCRELADKGGSVYVQDPASCVVSTMIDGVRETGVVAFQGTPKELAAKLLAEGA